MKRWRGLALGTLTMFLLSAPLAEAAAQDAAHTMTVEERDAIRAAKAAERAQRQAERAAAKAERKAALAAAKAERAAEKTDAPTAQPAKAPSLPAPQTAPPPAAAPEPAAAETAAPEHAAAEPMAAEPAATPSAPSALSAPPAETAAPARQPSEKQTARTARQQALAERKAEREERKVALAAAKAEKRADTASAKADRRAAQKQRRSEKNARFKTLFVDNGFTYYLDTKGTRWVPRPYNTEEYMIDAWVRLVENTTGAPVAENGKIRPAKYFLEHYYISEKRQEIMFLSELEVSGRPDNAVKERAYDPRHWEKLVPGSIEDALYEAITEEMPSPPGQRGGIFSGTSGMSLRDMIEEYGRISF